MELRLTITDIANSGLGVARRPDGRVVMVENALPGEIVVACPVEERKGYVLAACHSILEASLERVEPPCPWFGLCGGCDMQHLKYSAQLAAKEKWLQNAFRGLAPLPEIKVVASPLPFGYRHRLRLHSSADNKVAGFYARGSNHLVEVEDCWLAAQPAREQWQAIRRISLPGLEEMEILAGNNEVWLSLAGKSLIKRRVAGLEGIGLRWPGEKLDFARGLVYYQREGLGMRAWPGQFSQANWEVNREMIANLLLMAGPYLNSSLVLDLFAGSGNLSLPLARAGARVRAVEGNALACAAGRYLAEENRVKCDFSALSVSRFLANNSGLKPGLVILDPPRGGAKGLMPTLVGLDPQAIIYISCHPAACARDAVFLSQAGYRLSQLALLDMFPQTGQMECMALFAKTRTGANKSI